MLKYIIFDFDGTLADSRNVFISAWNSLADKYQYQKIQREELNVLRKLPIRERIKRLNFPIFKAPLIIPDFYRYYRKYSKEINLYPGIKELLDSLEKKGYNIAIISSNSEDVIKDVLRRNQVRNISTIISSSLVFGKDKLMRKFLHDHRLGAREVIYVGDEQRDILACKSAGVKIIWVSWGYDAKELIQKEKPDYLVDSPEEILDVVLRG
ncbi:HAD-IA family hydrolase [Alkalihalobacillus sp. MEB130]|uniref:HAD-IA family hydrolase n=1 Tax=Alkalihalobacillus sp. MEB130 TaxID=2976704 RepID=UPI0028E045B6|nr:HAD-IA family hydrolase [Alkalihalobacillus sp. MEB130]MDT8860184.1 HAD-IA family hydrolase [Alkalihalobacillus sp. MEB130]